MKEILEALKAQPLELKILLSRLGFCTEESDAKLLVFAKLNKAATAGLVKVKDSKDGYIVSLTAKGKKSLT